jgi:histidinol-phosphate aminotransferase
MSELRTRLLKDTARVRGYRIARTLLSRTPLWSDERRREYALARLRQTFIRAMEGVPYYRESFREAGFDPRSDLRDLDDLGGLPLLTKATIREQGGLLYDKRYRRWAIPAQTSGTTGEPLRMLLNVSFVAFDSACIFRHWFWSGYRWRDRVVALRSYVPTAPQAPLWRWDPLQNTLFMSAYHLTPANAQDYLDQVLRVRPVLIKAYPSSAAVLAEYAYARRDQFAFLRGIYVSSETLTPSERATIEGTFGPRLFNWYGMTEPAIVLTECEVHDGMHVNWEYGHCELIPADDLPANEFRLVTTGYRNPVMPFIRYDTGDVVRVDNRDRRCSCGRNMPVVDTVAGRKDECIVTPDGRRLPSVNFYTLFRGFNEILKFQIVQYGRREVTVGLVFRESATDIAGVVARVRQEMQARLGRDVLLDVRAADRFVTNRDGKTPPIVRKAGSRAVEEREEYAVATQLAWAAHRAGRTVLKLDWNEADRLPSTRVRERVRMLLDDDASFCWYPEALSEELVDRLASYVGVPESHILPVHGSDLGIELVAGAFLHAGDRVAIVAPTYDNFRAVMEQRGAEVELYTYLGKGRFPLEHWAQHLRKAPPRMVYLTNPNNPIGYVLEREALSGMIDVCSALGCMLVVDEAYAEFSGITIADEVVRDPPLVVLRTFSKAFGLAGIRLGYVVAGREAMRVLRRVNNPKNVTMFAKAAGVAALEGVDEMRRYVAEVRACRAEVEACLTRLGVETYPSSANFLLLKHPRSLELTRFLEARDILVRDRSRYFGGVGHVRLTIGGRASTVRVQRALVEFFQAAATEAAVAGTGIETRDEP